MKQTILIICVLSISLLSYSQNSYDVSAKKNEINKESKTLKMEEEFVQDNFPFVHMADWKPGMRFIVKPSSGDSDKIDLRPYREKRKKKDSYHSGILQKEFEWKIFTFIGLEESLMKCRTGLCLKTYVILDCEGEKFEFPYLGLGGIEVMRSSNKFTYINKLVYLNEIDKARELLINRKMYIMTERWKKEKDGTNGVFTLQKKFVPVTIVNVGINTSRFFDPVKIVFKTEKDEEYFVCVKLSGTNQVESTLQVDFAKAFNFNNPHNSYSHITNEIWDLIQNHKIQIGMTEEECRLSWGKPNEINRSSYQDQWVYSSQYLYFEGGRLTAFN